MVRFGCCRRCCPGRRAWPRLQQRRRPLLDPLAPASELLRTPDSSFNSMASLVAVQLPVAWQQMLMGGQLLTALILSTVYSEKYRGRMFKAGQTTEVRLPVAGESRAWITTLLHRHGGKENSAFTWLGDSEAGDQTLYVGFGPFRQKRQFAKLVTGRSLQTVAVPAIEDGGGGELNCSAYVKHLLDDLWEKRGFASDLLATITKYPDHRVVFTGISHGGALAQAAALRFALAGSRNGIQQRIWIVSWNAYKWTDDVGSRLIDETLRGRMLPLVLSDKSAETGRRADSLPGFPPGLSPMRTCVLLDVEAGEFFPCGPIPESALDFGFAWRAMDLHFATTANKAMKQAMAKALEVDAASQQKLSSLRQPATAEPDLMALDAEATKSAHSKRSALELEDVSDGSDSGE